MQPYRQATILNCMASSNGLHFFTLGMGKGGYFRIEIMATA
jgi:hypothetical protein